MADKKKLPLTARRQIPTRQAAIIKRVKAVLDAALGFRGDNLELQGNFTVWDDMQNSLIGRRLASTAGKVDYNYSEVAIDFSAGGVITNINDCVVFPLQMSHSKKLGTDIKLHLHFEQTDLLTRTFDLAYRIQKQGAAKTTAWTTISLNTTEGAFQYVSGTLNQIAGFPSIPVNDTGVSDIVQCKMTRTDSQTGIVSITFADAHFERDSFGSAGEYSKWTE